MSDLEVCLNHELYEEAVPVNNLGIVFKRNSDRMAVLYNKE